MKYPLSVIRRRYFTAGLNQFCRTGTKLSGLVLVLALQSSMQAELKLPAIVSDHMVLQQNQSNPIWGWDAPGTKITVTFGGQTKSAEAGPDGKWTVKLDPVPA